MRILIFTLLSFICFNHIIEAQTIHFKQYSLEEGLPQSEAFTIIQDSLKNIWIGTNGGGLCRFNGVSFSRYGINQGLIDQRVKSLHQDENSNIWIGCGEGLSKFNGKIFRNFHPEENVPKANYFKIESNNQIVWIAGTKNNKTFILKYENGKFINFSKQEEKLNNNTIFDICKINNKIFFVSLKGLYQYTKDRLVLSDYQKHKNLKNKVLFPINYNSQNDETHILAYSGYNKAKLYKIKDDKLTNIKLGKGNICENINKVFIDSKNRIWVILRSKGLLMINEKGEEEFMDQHNGLPTVFINDIFEDSEHNIWLATSGNGILRYSNSKFLSYNFTDIAGGNMIWEIFVDSKSNKYFGISGKGLLKINSKGKRKFYSAKNTAGLFNIKAITEIENNKLLIGGHQGVLEYNNGIFKNKSDKYGIPANTRINDICQSEKKIYFATARKGVIIFDKTHKETKAAPTYSIYKGEINDIFLDSKNNLWMVYEQGISVYDNESISHYNYNYGYPISSIMQITEDKKGRIWAVSFNQGLFVFDGFNWNNINYKDGLSSEIAYSILSDSIGRLWVGMQNGVDIISFNKEGEIYKIYNYDKNDGFLGIENNSSCNFIDAKSDLWFGTINGAYKHHFQEDELNTEAPVIQIVDIDLFYEDIDWTSEEFNECTEESYGWFCVPNHLELPYYNNHISIKFEALSYRSPEKIRYKWMLDGFDKNWSPETNNNKAVYQNIPPGKYKLQIKACNSDGIWTKEPYSYNFTILPPWWKTTWATAIFLLIISGIIYLISSFRYRQIKVKKKRLETIVRKKTKEIRLQNNIIENKNKELEAQKNEILKQAKKIQKSYINLIHLNDIGKAITANLSAEKIIDIVYDSLNELLGADIFGIGIIDDSNKLFFPRIKQNGENIDAYKYNTETDNNYLKKVLENNKQIIKNKLNGNESDNIFLKGIKSLAYIPLKTQDTTNAILIIGNKKQDSYKDYHIVILQNIAVYAGIALENAQSYRRLKSQSIRLERANFNIVRQKEEIETKNLELTDLNNEKNHLIGIIAHDLKNPLSSSISIANYIKNILKENKLEEEYESVSFMINSLMRMNAMILKILDVSKIESKKIDLKLEKIHLSSLINDITKEFEERLQIKKIRIYKDIIDSYIYADINFLTQIYENLISNAIKFSAYGKKININIFESETEIISIIEDQGPGIKDEDMNRLFGKFQILSAKPTGGESSTGLGLSIVKKFVEAMNGKVWCESTEGKGSKFFISLKKQKLKK
ncbi:MAG: ATP-binding protein [Marinifilaceae bacterium]|jgi:signal transduction histidine kinase/ligand-binding sensor domain-containing protein|nr:ATP-binding protein [Marinifilaceae bacterium]